MAGVNPTSGEGSSGREIEQLLRSAVSSTHDSVVITDVAGKILYVNEACLRLHGYRESELLGQPVSILQSSKNPPGFSEAAHRATIQGEWSGEVLDVTKDGREFTLHLTSTVVRDSAGNPTAAIGIGRVSKEVRKPENALRSTQEFLVSLLEHTPAAIFVRSADERFLLVNNEWERITGKRREDVLGCKVKDVFPQDAARLFRESDLAVFNTKGPVTVEAVIPLPDGPRVIKTVKFPVRDAAGNITAVAGVSMDITSSRRAEVALRESEERYRQLFEMSPDTIVVHDGEKILYVNSAGLRLLGARNSADLVGHTLIDHVSPEHRDLARERCRLVLQEGRSVPRAEMKLIRVDGSIVDVELTCAPLNLQGRRVVHSVIRNVKERTRKEPVLPISEGLVEQLTHIIAYSEVLVTRLASDERTRSYAQRIADSAKRAQTIMSDPVVPATGNGPIPASSPVDVLVVEDDDITREFIRQALEAGGYRVHAGRNGQEGVQLFRDNASSIRLILTDIVMPQMAGDAMVAEIRKLSGTVPILVVSGFAHGDAGKRLRELNVTAFIDKPTSAAGLLQQVQQALTQNPVS